MIRRVSAREARQNFAEITDRVCYTGEPVIVEKQGRPCVALVRLEDLDALAKFRAEQRQDAFSQRAPAAAQQSAELPPDDEDVV